MAVGPTGCTHLASHAHRDVIEQRLGELLLDGRNILLPQVRSNEAHAAVDVEADAARGHDGLRVVHVDWKEGGNAFSANRNVKN